MSTPSSESAISMALTVLNANASLFALAAGLSKDDLHALTIMQFPPCGTPGCSCHLRKTTIKDLILSCHADLTKDRSLNSNDASPTQGLDAQAATQNRRFN